MSETFADQVERVALMAAGHETWDLSDNDTAALRAVLNALALVRAALDDCIQVAFDGPREPKGTNCDEGYGAWRKRIEREAKDTLARSGGSPSAARKG